MFLDYDRDKAQKKRTLNGNLNPVALTNIIPDLDTNLNPNVKENEDMNVDNGRITLDETDENGERKKIWIPENVHYVKPSL